MDDKFEVLFDLAKKSFEEIIQEVQEEEAVPCDEFPMETENALSIIVGITGEVSGRLLINVSVENAKKLATAMNFGDELENEEDLYVYLAEFANMSCGRMATHMNDRYGKRMVWIAPPAIFSAQNLEVITPHITTKKQCYKTSMAQYTVDVGYNDGCLYDEF